MAATAISNIVVPKIFSPYVVERSTTLSNILSSGIAQRTPAFDEMAGAKGKLFEMPYFNDLSGDAEVLADGTALTINNITAEQETAVKFMRGKAWGATDLASAVAGEDIMRSIGDMVAGYWARSVQTTLMNIMGALFHDSAGSIWSTHVSDQGSTDITSSMVVDTMALLGDNSSSLTTMIVHSATYAALQKASLIDYTRDADNNIMFSTYLGKRLIVDDSCATSGSGATTEYRSYLFGNGAFAYGVGSIDNATEVDRDTLKGEDILINRQHFILHPRGLKFAGAVAGASPTDGEVGAGADWTQVWDNQNIKMVCLIAGV
jgi:hypothetical protein